MTLVKNRIPGLHTGIERLSAFFESRTTRQGLLARRALGRLTEGDEVLRTRLIQELRGETRLDGSLGGAVVPTIWRVIELMELGHRPDEAGVIRVVGWVLGLQDQPGAFGQGCDETRHANKVCEHFVSGFFSPALPSERLSPVSLPNGNVFRSESAARFAVSCLALRATLIAGHDTRPAVVRHLDSLVTLQQTWTRWDGYFAPDAMVAALGPLAVAPPPFRERLPEAAAFVARH